MLLLFSFHSCSIIVDDDNNMSAAATPANVTGTALVVVAGFAVIFAIAGGYNCILWYSSRGAEEDGNNTLVGGAMLCTREGRDEIDCAMFLFCGFRFCVVVVVVTGKRLSFSQREIFVCSVSLEDKNFMSRSD